MQTDYQQEKIKIMFIGSKSVGKTSIIDRFFQNLDPLKKVSTVGLKMKQKQININKKIYNLQIWDTAGKDCYRKITQAHYRFSKGVVLVFDLTSKQSFNDLNEWLNEIRGNCDENVKIIIVGNKKDLKDEKRIVDYDRAKNFADLNECKYIETSAKEKEAESINQIFNLLIEGIEEEKMKKEQNEIGIISINKSKCNCQLY